MRILVTGSSGFIGTALVSHLADRGHVIAGLDRVPPRAGPHGEAVVCDLLDGAGVASTVAAFRPEVIIHLAAKTSLKEVPPGSDHYAANTEGTGHLIAAAVAAGCVRRIIHTSTKYVHRGNLPANDRDYQPTTSYGRSKAEMEKLIWARDGMIAEWCITRPTTVWGPGMGKHYQGFLRMLEKGRYFHIGHAPVMKHMAYVGNIVCQYAMLAEALPGLIHRKVFYLADYEAMVISDWAESLREALGAPSIRTIPRPVARCIALAGDAIAHCGYPKFPFTTFRYHNLTVDDVCDPSLTMEVCGELPFTTKEGARETANWFKGLKDHA
jgi:GlcNAc-P-P-Und epimerase